MSNAFAPILRARPCPIFGRPVHPGSPPIDYSPILLLKPFGFRITPDTLSSSEISRWPARHYPRLWIQRPSSERRRDFNPPDSCAAQRTLRVSPPQLPASVLSPRGGVPLVLLPWHQEAGSCSSAQKPASNSRPLYAGHSPSSHQAPDGLVPEEISASGFCGDNELSRRVLDGFALARLSDAHLPQITSGTFDPTLTTTALYRSSSDWFETCS